MPRVSQVHYILPSNINITPNANGSANDLAVYVTNGATIKVYSPRAGVNMIGTEYQEWALSGRNRRLANPNSPYTLYARLPKQIAPNVVRTSGMLKGYLVFAPKDERDGAWYDKYCYVTPDGLFPQLSDSHPDGCRVLDDMNWWVKLGDVSMPEDGQRTVTLDTGILGTELYNNEWAVNPDALPLRVDLGCTIGDEDAGPTPYVYWDKSLVLTATLTEGWTGTDITRFRHWQIERSSGDPDADDAWNHPDGPGSYRDLPGGVITLYHPRDGHDDFNGAVSALFTVTAWGVPADDPESETLVKIESANINILAETVEQYELILSSLVVGYSPQTGEYTPESSVAIVRATDQRGDMRDLTRRQVDTVRLTAFYAEVDSDVWISVPFSGLDNETAEAVIGQTAFSGQKSLNVRLLNADGKEIDRKTIAFVRDGEDSREREWIFLRSREAITFGDADSEHPKPALISGGEVNPSGAARPVTTNKDQDGWVPEGWYDEQQGISDEYPYEYGSYRDYVRESEGESEGGHWGDFTDPKIWNHYGKDGEMYVINTNIDTITIPADTTSTEATIVAAFARMAGADGPQAFQCHYAAYRRHGDTYSRFAASAASKVDGRTFADLEVSSDIESANNCEAVVIFISNSPLSDESLAGAAPSAYLSKKEITVIKAGDTGPKGEDAYVVEVNPEYAIFDETVNGDVVVVDTSGWTGKVRVLKGGAPQRFLLTYGQHSYCFPDTGSTADNTHTTEATLKFGLIKDADNNYIADGYLLLNVATDDGKFSTDVKVSYHTNLLGNFKKAAARWFLSKEWDDRAAGVIGFTKGLWVKAKGLFGFNEEGDISARNITAGKDVSVGGTITAAGLVKSTDYTGQSIGDTGWMITNSHNGHSKMVIDELYVRMKAVFESLEVKREQVTGGNQIFSGAANVIARTEYIHQEVVDGQVEETVMGYSEIPMPFTAGGLLLSLYKSVPSIFGRLMKVRLNLKEEDIPLITVVRCYFLAKEGDNEVSNLWHANENGHDLVRCQTFNLTKSKRETYIDTPAKAGNVFWWRKATKVSTTPVDVDGKQYHYVDVSMSDCMSGSDIPAAGDHMVQWGNDANPERMNIITIEVNGADSPAVKAYEGIYCYDMHKCWYGGNPCKMSLSPKSGYKFIGSKFHLETEYGIAPVPTNRGNYTDIPLQRDDKAPHNNVRKVYYYDQVSHNGSMWTCTSQQNAYWVMPQEFDNPEYALFNADGTYRHNGNYITDAEYAGLSIEHKEQCGRVEGYITDEPSEVSSAWIKSVSKGDKGDSITKKSEVKQYVLSTDGVNPKSGEQWSDTKPTPAQGEYVLTKTTITWSDDSVTTLISSEKNPNDGEPGQDIIVDGDTVMLYCVTDSNTSHPAEDSAEWKPLSQVTQTQGKWLWSKATTYYRKASSAAGARDAGSSVNYNVMYISKDGKTGRGIQSITEYYQATNSSEARQKPASESGWDTDPNLSHLTDKWDATHKYLWNMEKTVYINVDGSTTTEYTIPQILAIWTKDGAAGRGIDSIANYYKVTDSATAPSKPSTPGTDGWSATPLAPNQGEYLWNYEVITWVNGTPAKTETDVQMIGYAGEDGASITKQSETYRYATNNTGTRPAAGSSDWKTTKPTLQKGYWLYTETTITWSDGSTTVLYTDERNPNDGINGQDIVVDGSTVMKYYVGDSNTTHPAEDSTDWKDLSQVVQTQGKWLWSKATTWYKKSDSSAGSHDAGHSVNYNVMYISKDGKTGRGIQSITEYYQATNSSEARQKPASESGWDTDPNLSHLTDKWDANHKYLWNMEKTVYSNVDGSTTTEYTIPQILAIWTKDGEPGRGIDSIVNKYKVTDTSAVPSREHEGGSGWSSTPLAPANGQYLWNYEIINWTKGTTPTYTDVQQIGYAGTNGTSIMVTQVFKLSADQPATPTDDTIPPSGWSELPPSIPSSISKSGGFEVETQGTYAGWRVGRGENKNNAFKKDVLTFKTTNANEVIRIEIAVSSENGCDFIAVSPLDTEVSARPSNIETSAIYQGRKLSGMSASSLVVETTVSTAGTHSITVFYTKDHSEDSGSDCGWYRVIDAIWTSVNIFENGVKQGDWSTPVRWNGESGQDAVAIKLSPENVIITQSTEADASGNYNLLLDNAKTDVSIAAGGSETTTGLSITATPSTHVVNGVSRPSCSVSVSGNTVKIDSVDYEDVTEGTETRRVYVDSGYVDVSAVFNGHTYKGRFNFYCNLLGTWKETVVGDTKTEVAKSLSYAYTEDGQGVQTLENLGSYIKSSTENISTLTKKINNGKNLLSGVITGSGWKSSAEITLTTTNYHNISVDDDGYFNVVTSSDHYLVSPLFNVEQGVEYTLSFYWNSGGTYSIGVKGSATDIYTTSSSGGGITFRFTAAATEQVRLFIGCSSITRPQVEVGSVATSFDAGTTEITSQIKQTADGITSTVQRDYATKSQLQQTADGINASITNLDNRTQTALNLKANSADLTTMQDGLETAGVHLDGANSKIRLNASNVEVSENFQAKTVLTENNDAQVFISGGTIVLASKKSGNQSRIEFGVDDSGNCLLNYYDSNGNFKYGLGPDEIFRLKTQAEEFRSAYYCYSRGKSNCLYLTDAEIALIYRCVYKQYVSVGVQQYFAKIAQNIYAPGQYCNTAEDAARYDKKLIYQAGSIDKISDTDLFSGLATPITRVDGYILNDPSIDDADVIDMANYGYTVIHTYFGSIEQVDEGDYYMYLFNNGSTNWPVCRVYKDTGAIGYYNEYSGRDVLNFIENPKNPSELADPIYAFPMTYISNGVAQPNDVVLYINKSKLDTILANN